MACTFIFTSLSKTDRRVEDGMWLPGNEGEVKDWTQGQGTNSCIGCSCRILHYRKEGIVLGGFRLLGGVLFEQRPEREKEVWKPPK